MELTVTDNARDKMHFFLQDKGAEQWGIRIVVKTIGDYGFSMVELNSVQSSDTVLPVKDLKVVIDAISAGQLEGATVDFVESDAGSGFKVERKTIEQTLPEGVELDMKDPLAQQIHRVIEDDINPGIASHGGVAKLRGLAKNVVYLEMGGGCQGCAQSAATLRQGIETRIKEVVPQITDVVDVTDHATGVNPYYK